MWPVGLAICRNSPGDQSAEDTGTPVDDHGRVDRRAIRIELVKQTESGR